jgi:predicted NUDIX family NTP pyrophosphohydrolase
MEPEEIIRWEWFSLDELPAKIFVPSRKVIDNYRADRLTGDL